MQLKLPLLVDRKLIVFFYFRQKGHIFSKGVGESIDFFVLYQINNTKTMPSVVYGKFRQVQTLLYVWSANPQPLFGIHQSVCYSESFLFDGISVNTFSSVVIDK